MKHSFKDYMCIKEAKNPLLEELAEIEHDQWMEWANSIMESEDISPDRVNRWKKLMVSYAELSEESKEQDRVYARKVIDKFSEMATEGQAAKQMFIQGKALKMLSKGRNEIIISLIDIYGSDFRGIINDFQARLGRLPSPDDLIWVAGVHTGKDPRVVAKALLKELDS